MKCGQEGCEALAVVSYEWPGRGRLYACSTHADKAIAIGEALGMALTVTSYEEIPSVQDLRRDLRLALDALERSKGARPGLEQALYTERDEARRELELVRKERDSARRENSRLTAICEEVRNVVKRA